MTEHVENLILEQLRKVRAVQEGHTEKIDELQKRLNGIESQVFRISRENTSTYAELIEDRHRLDSCQKRLECLEL